MGVVGTGVERGGKERPEQISRCFGLRIARRRGSMFERLMYVCVIWFCVLRFSCCWALATMTLNWRRALQRWERISNQTSSMMAMKTKMNRTTTTMTMTIITIENIEFVFAFFQHDFFVCLIVIVVIASFSCAIKFFNSVIIIIIILKIKPWKTEK